jgi:hypothetical protein
MNSPTAPEFPGQASAAAAHDTLAHIADRVGATASFLCAVHCAALPFVLALLPALGLSFLADHKFERIFIACASCLALVALIRGYRRHHVASALFIAVPGLILLWVGAWIFDAESSLALHATLVATGGCCVALAHILNLRLTHLFGACCEPGSGKV